MPLSHLSPDQLARHASPTAAAIRTIHARLTAEEHDWRTVYATAPTGAEIEAVAIAHIERLDERRGAVARSLYAYVAGGEDPAEWFEEAWEEHREEAAWCESVAAELGRAVGVVGGAASERGHGVN